MSRYIDADALKIPSEEIIAKMLINSAPSIDIVRCRECKHREEYPCKVYHDDDWYCADGEREDER